MKSRKKEIEKLEEKLDKLGGEEDFPIEVVWLEYGQEEPLHKWKNKDGSIEYLTKEEYKKRGGVIIEWDDEAC